MAQAATAPASLTSGYPSTTHQNPKHGFKSPPRLSLTTSIATGASISTNKRKLSKSRNGCQTCKAKRLKCDETKPSCHQCQRRGVVCGGYNKDFKWRAFEEASFTGKSKSRARKAPSSPTPISAKLSCSPSPIESCYTPTTPASLPYNTLFAPPPSPLSSSALSPNLSSFCFSQPSLYAPVLTPYTPAGIPVFEPALGPLQAMPDGTPIPSPDTRFYFQDSSCPGVLFAAQPEIYASSTPCSTPLLEPLGAIIPGAVETIEKTEGDLEEILPADWTSHCGFSTSPGSSSSSSDSALKPQPQLSLDSPESLTRYFDRDTCGILSVTDGPTENPWRTLVWPLARVYPALYHAIASMTSFHHSRDSQTFRIQGIEHVRSAVAELAANMGGMHIHAAISTTLALAFAESWDQHISTGNHHIKGAKLMLDEALLQYRRQPSNQAETDRLRFLCNSWLYRDVIARLTSAEGDYSNDFDYYFDVLALDGQEKTRLDPLMGCARTLFPIIGCVANLVRKVRHSGYNDPGILSEAAELKRQLEHWTPPSHIEDPEDETMSVQDSIHTARAYLDATLLYLHQAVPDLPSLSPSILATSVLDALASVGPASRSVIVHIYPLMAAGCEATLPSERNWVRRRWKMLASRMKLGILEKCQIVTEEVWRRRDENALRIGDQKGNATVAKRTRKRRLSSTLEDLESDTLSCWCEDGRKRRVLDGLSGTALSLPTDYHWNEVDSSGDAESDASTQLVPIKQMLIGFNQPFSEGSAFQNAETEFLDPDFTVTGRLHWLGVMTEWKWEIFLG